MGERLAGGRAALGPLTAVRQGDSSPGPPLGARIACGEPRLAARDRPFREPGPLLAAVPVTEGPKRGVPVGGREPLPVSGPRRADDLPRLSARCGSLSRSRDQGPQGSRGVRGGPPTGTCADTPVCAPGASFFLFGTFEKNRPKPIRCGYYVLSSATSSSVSSSPVRRPPL